MTRQKKELIKRIDFLTEMSQADSELGCGFGQRDPNDAEINQLMSKLAQCQHYQTVEDMLHDDRSMR